MPAPPQIAPLIILMILTPCPHQLDEENKRAMLLLGVLEGCSLRRFLADTTAMIIFSTCVGMFIEIIVAGLTIEQSALVRLTAIPVILFAGRPYGIYRDWLLRCLPETSRTELSVSAVDTLANTSFQVSLYVILLAMNGASTEQVLKASTTAAVVNFVIGRPYGYFLDFWRKLF